MSHQILRVICFQSRIDYVRHPGNILFWVDLKQLVTLGLSSKIPEHLYCHAFQIMQISRLNNQHLIQESIEIEYTMRMGQVIVVAIRRIVLSSEQKRSNQPNRQLNRGVSKKHIQINFIFEKIAFLAIHV